MLQFLTVSRFWTQMYEKMRSILFLNMIYLSGSNRDHLHGSSNGHTQKTNDDTCKPLGESKRTCVCKGTQEFDNNDLEDGGGSYNSQKHVVFHYSFKHVYLLHLSGANLIEQLRISKLHNYNIYLEDFLSFYFRKKSF